MHHHHFDEFSVTDIRHTLGEVWRVVRDRRWFFLLPFLGVSTVALIASLWVPRQWTVSTIIRREHDPVLASMMGRSWTEPYTEIRQRMAGEVADPETIEKVLAGIGLPHGVEQFSNGELAPSGRSARKMLVSEIAAGLAVKQIETSPNRDVVLIRLTMSDPLVAPEALRALRDEYIRKAQKRTTEILRSVEKFFQGESNRCREQLADFQKKLMEFDVAYPGINPDSTDPSKTEQSDLLVENAQFGRQIEELQQAEHDLETARLAAEAALTSMTVAPEPEETEEPNPEFAALTGEVERLQKDIVEARTQKGMTDLHPLVQRMTASLESKQELLERTPAVIKKAVIAIAVPGPTPLQRIQNQSKELNAKLVTIQNRVKLNHEKLARIERSRAAMMDQREPYAKLKDKVTRANEELATWQANLGPLKHILTLEDSNRGIHFATVRDVDAAVRPSAPDPRVALGICLAIGGAFGAVVVLLAELLDRSFRTAQSLTTTLGVPLIESIDEILTASTRKRRILQRLIVMPTLAMAMSFVMLVAGAMAFMSIDNPGDYDAFKKSPHRVFSLLLGSSR
ncbi:MAG: hypothetical protein AABZ08_12040 [Planctomycetota bacterium]